MVVVDGRNAGEARDESQPNVPLVEVKRSLVNNGLGLTFTCPRNM